MSVTETDDAFVTVSDCEGAIPQVLCANYGGQQKQYSHSQLCPTDHVQGEFPRIRFLDPDCRAALNRGFPDFYLPDEFKALKSLDLKSRAALSSKIKSAGELESKSGYYAR
jgi:hypothetical protein